MSLPETYVPRKGDVLALHITVDWLSRSPTPTIYGYSGSAPVHCLAPSEFDHVVAYFFAAGDRVKNTTTGHLGTVLAAHVDVLWVLEDGSTWPGTLPINNAVRIDPKEEETDAT